MNLSPSVLATVPPAPALVAAPARRVAHLDVARGVSILLVALYHSGLQPLMPSTMQALGLCRLPLFFFLAGAVFPLRRPLAQVLTERSRALLRPYAIVLLVLLGRSLWKGDVDPWAVLLGIAWANGGTIEWIPMWFLPHLWLVSTAAAVLLHRSGWLHWPTAAQAASGAALLAAGVMVLAPDRIVALPWQGGTGRALPWWPFSADLLGVSLAFLLLGARLQRQARAFAPRGGTLLAALLVFLWVAMGTDAQINLNLRRYGSPLLATAGALAGLYLILSAAWGLSRLSVARRSLGHLGQASLFILIFHDHIDNKVQAWLGPRLGGAQPWTVALVAFACSLAVPLLIREAAVRLPPLAWLFGQRPPAPAVPARG